jgi:aminopeptidase N
MDLYFTRHDGQAVTTDDFVAAMEDANGADLQQFRRWYHQAGTPEIKTAGQFDQNTGTYTLTVRQSCPPTPGQPHKTPFHIPLTLALLNSDGQELPLQLEHEPAPAGTQRVLQLFESEQDFRFINIPTPVTPSLLRGFSAPVKLDAGYSDEDLMFLLTYDSDSFNRWEAAHTLAIRTILGLVEERRQNQPWRLSETFAFAFARALGDASADPALLNQILILLEETYLAEQMDVVDVDGIHEARNFVRRSLAKAVKDLLLAQHAANYDAGEYHIDALSVGRRSLKNRCLDYLMQLGEATIRQRCLKQYQTANNMTDALSALSMLANCDCPERRPTLADFYQRWQQEPLVLDKWFMIQATSELPGTLDEVKTLLQHPAFNLKNPNKVRALIGAFCQGNPVRFHAIDGSGYTFLTEQVLTLNTVNPQIAARLMGSFTRWRKYDPQRQALMRKQLERILSAPQLSPDVYEIAAKSLEADEKQ